MLIGAPICTACVVIIGGMSRLPQGNKTGPTIIVVMTCLWMFSYAISVPAASYAYLTEVSTLTLRSKAVEFGLMLQSATQIVFVRSLKYCFR